MKKAILLSLGIMLTGCIDKTPQPSTTGTVAKTEMPAVKDGFQQFLNQFPEIALPLEIKGCETQTDLKALNTAISSPFLKEERSYIYGKFAFGNKYLGVITLHAADCLFPCLTVYSLNGNRIDSKPLAIGQCSDGPCYKCEELLTIGKDLTINVADTMQTFECDEDDLPKGNSLITTVIYREGKITATGRIELSKEKEKKL